MVRITIIFGVLLIALGLGDYYATDAKRWTELIPAALGAALGMTMVVLGLVSLKESVRKNAMHAAVLLGLLGFAFTVRALIDLARVILDKPQLVAQSIMALLCGAYMVMAVKSFLDDRRSRPAAVEPPVEQPQAPVPVKGDAAEPPTAP
jgi:hypothetical protein